MVDLVDGPVDSIVFESELTVLTLVHKVFLDLLVQSADEMDELVLFDLIVNKHLISQRVLPSIFVPALLSLIKLLEDLKRLSSKKDIFEVVLVFNCCQQLVGLEVGEVVLQRKGTKNSINIKIGQNWINVWVCSCFLLGCIGKGQAMQGSKYYAVVIIV